MNKGEYVYTPRFCGVKISEVFQTKDEAKRAGFTELTHYDNPNFGVLGRSIDMYHMDFAAYRK